jgi:hypothetical protein
MHSIRADIHTDFIRYLVEADLQLFTTFLKGTHVCHESLRERSSGHLSFKASDRCGSVMQKLADF